MPEFIFVGRLKKKKVKCCEKSQPDAEEEASRGKSGHPSKANTVLKESELSNPVSSSNTLCIVTGSFL